MKPYDLPDTRTQPDLWLSLAKRSILASLPDLQRAGGCHPLLDSLVRKLPRHDKHFTIFEKLAKADQPCHPRTGKESERKVRYSSLFARIHPRSLCAARFERLQLWEKVCSVASGSVLLK